MAYQVSSLTVSVNGVRTWIPLHQSPIRRKAEAIALADAQPIRAWSWLPTLRRKCTKTARTMGAIRAYCPAVPARGACSANPMRVPSFGRLPAGLHRVRMIQPFEAIDDRTQ